MILKIREPTIPLSQSFKTFMIQFPIRVHMWLGVCLTLFPALSSSGNVQELHSGNSTEDPEDTGTKYPKKGHYSPLGKLNISAISMIYSSLSFRLW